MNVEYANIFIASAVRVFEQEARIRMSRQALSKKESPAPSLPVAIILGITGFVRGQVVYAMDDGFAYSVARAMLPDKLPAEVKRLTHSAVSELANIITGQASISLAGDRQRIDLTPPAVLSGQALAFDFLDIPTVSLRLISEIGGLEINIALLENGRR